LLLAFLLTLALSLGRGEQVEFISAFFGHDRADIRIPNLNLLLLGILNGRNTVLVVLIHLVYWLQFVCSIEETLEPLLLCSV